ncbi:MAG: hypothetical protein QOH41_1520 [Blastocatellia bacterium]|jgi:hypothetical protein|nr:hypothetical protein [Blastocatellia bacterium]
MNVTPAILALGLIVMVDACLTAKPRQLPNQIITSVMNDLCSSGCSDEQRANYQRNIRFELHDLDGDRIAEIFVYVRHPDWCGNHFNCAYSVFQRRQDGYRLIASAYPGLHVSNRVTHGYRDLESRHDIGVCVFPNRSLGRDVFINVLRYDGTQYKATDLGEQCRKPVPAPRFQSAASNKSLDASGGRVFRNLIHPAMLD